MTGISDISNAIGIVVSVILGALGGVLAARRQWSKDQSSAAKDRAETDIISRLTDRERQLTGELNAALARERMLLEQQVEDGKRIAGLEARLLIAMKDLRRALRQMPEEQAAAFRPTDHAPLESD